MFGGSWADAWRDAEASANATRPAARTRASGASRDGNGSRAPDVEPEDDNCHSPRHDDVHCSTSSRPRPCDMATTTFSRIAHGTGLGSTFHADQRHRRRLDGRHQALRQHPRPSIRLSLELHRRPGDGPARSQRRAARPTAVRLLLGLTASDAGTVRLFGGPPADSATVRQRVGAMLQVARVPDTLTVREHLHAVLRLLPQRLGPVERIDRAGGARRASPIGVSASCRAASGNGCCSPSRCAGIPTCWCWTSPTVGMDVGSRRSLWEAIRDCARARRGHPADHALPRGGRRPRRPRRRAEARSGRRRRHAGATAEFRRRRRNCAATRR